MKQRMSWTGAGGHVIRVGGVLLGLVATAVVSWTGTVHGVPPTPQTSPNTWQSSVRTAAATFEKNKILAISTCLQKISGDIIKSNIAISTTTAKLCAAQFRKIKDSRMIGLSLEEKKAFAINKKCETGMSMVTHNINDITGNAGGAAPPPGIETNNIEAWCQNFGGSGTIATVQDWIDCIDNAHECAADLAISVQYPRALEWLNLVKPLIAALVAPATDPNKYTDAVTAISQVVDAIDGPDLNGVPSMQCGKAAPAVCSTACCYQEFSLGVQVSCFQYTGTATEVGSFSTVCAGKTSTPPPSWTMVAAAGVCGNPPDFPAHVACPAASTVVIPKDSSCP